MGVDALRMDEADVMKVERRTIKEIKKQGMG